MITLFLALLSTPPAFSACGDASAAVNAKWEQASVKLKASTDKALAPELPLETKIELALPTESKKGYSGFAKVSAAQGGNYEVALGERVWVNLVDAGTHASLRPAQFKKGEASAGAKKTIVFPLAAGRLYFLEVSAAKAPALALLLHSAN